MNGWVTDPDALRVIMELNEIRPGDEVRLKDVHTYGISRNMEGAVVTITVVSEVHPRSTFDEDLEGRRVRFVFDTTRGWLLNEHIIAAWKRPT